MTNLDEVKDKFYDDLDSVIPAAPRTDKLILLGDFNARMDHQTWEGVPGSEGVGKLSTSSVSSKTAYSNMCKTVQTRLRDMQDSWLSKKADGNQSFADKKDMKKFFDALKTIYSPRAQEPPHSLVQMELGFWLTKKLSWKDGLNTLMVSLIGHHLSMMKQSTDYHRWNVIRYLMSSQPSLKQWKQ